MRSWVASRGCANFVEPDKAEVPRIYLLLGNSVNRDTKEECVAPCRVTGYHPGVLDKGKPAARRGRKAHGPPREGR